MVMMGLMATEPILKNRHGSLVLDAARSLNLYCHRIWVSGKMMRWVSKLNLLVQRLISSRLPDDRSRCAPDMAGPGRGLDKMRLGSQSEAQDLPSQPDYPQGEDCVEDRPDHGVNGTLPTDGQGHMILTPEEDEHQRAPLSPYHTAGGRLDKSVSGLWALGGGPETQPSLPEWALSDFRFETLIHGDGATLVPSVAGEPSHHPGAAANGGLEDMDCRNQIGMEQDVDNSLFGTFGPAGLFDLDFEVEQAMKSLERNTSPNYNTQLP